MENTDQPSSICHVKPTQMYPLSTTEQKVDLPFGLLAGESVIHYGNSVEGLLVLTSYRLYVQLRDYQHHVPLGCIETVEQKELFHLHVGCKDARSYKCTFDNNEVCLDWCAQLTKETTAPRQLEDLFAFRYRVWSKENGGEDVAARIENQRQYVYDESAFKNEVERLKFDTHCAWRISSANRNYKLCPSYPPLLLVPSCITDEKLEIVSKFRSSRRIPAVVWRHSGNGAVIARCSQPEVGWLGWRSAEDEDLLKAISDACMYDRGPKSMLDKESNPSNSPTSVHSEDSGHTQLVIEVPEKKKVLIMDARSYTTAVANRARGGGCECPEYYPNCEIQFMNLANIHYIRKSFHALRQLCASSADQPNWFSQLEGTRWLQHMSGVMKAAVTLAKTVSLEARPVLVHCSDGWDRTPQIVALGELLLDPHYRTLDGFRILVEREWLAFGHKFADRCGHPTGSDDQNERCPVFLQWLDCVHQLWVQFKCHFEFSESYLVKLAQHTYSNLFGTFLCNTKQERVERVNEGTFSVWGFLNSSCYRNHLYAPPSKFDSPQVLWPQCNVRDLVLWNEVYLGSMEQRSTLESGSGSCPGPPDPFQNHMTKTRSYGDLPNAADACPNAYRRSSDPSITVEPISLNGLSTDDTETPEGSTTAETDESDCKSDCIYKEDEARKSGGELEDCDDDKTDDDVIVRTFPNEIGTFESICLGHRPTTTAADINHNGVATPPPVDDVDSDPSESRSENTIVNGGGGKEEKNPEEALRSVETSTETLVAENAICGSPEISGFEKLSNPDSFNGNGDICRTCAQNMKFVHGNKHSHHYHHSGSTSGRTSRYSTPPLYSRTTSANDWDNTFFFGNAAAHRPNLYPAYYQCNLGDDGLVPLRCDMQERLWQIIEDHRIREEELRRELQTYRRALINKLCHKCNHNDPDKTDETSSVVDSVCSAGEGPTSAVESLRSDLSWEAVEEGAALPEGTPTLWVPDHAVSRCTGCQTEFWLGRRKHHCRNCGRIFCADCSEYSTPLPSEHLYDPVRVCTSCFSKLSRRDCGEALIPSTLPEGCKQQHNNHHHHHPQPHPHHHHHPHQMTSPAAHNNPQIAASSN